MSSHTTMGPISSNIAVKISALLKPSVLEVHDESGNESRLRVVVVSESFAGLAVLKRHRLVYDLLDEEMKGAVHAIQLITKTNEEWTKQ